jgi:hypothetical protein
MHAQIKRPFVMLGVLGSIIRFMDTPPTPVGRDLQRFATFTLKELVENADNRADLLARAPVLPHIFESLKHPDSRVRKAAAWTLEKLGKEDCNKQIMLNAGNLNRLLSLLGMRSGEMRKAGAACLHNLTIFGDTMWNPSDPVDSQKQIEAARQALLGSLAPLVHVMQSETDNEVLQNLCHSMRNIIVQDHKRATGMVLQANGLVVLMDHAVRLQQIEAGTTAVVDALRLVVETMHTLMKEAPTEGLLPLLSQDRVGTVVTLCKSSNRKIRRGAAKMLALLSTLDEAKISLCQSETVALVLSLFKIQDASLQLVAARTLAELAESPQNRQMLIDMSCLPPIAELLPHADNEMRLELLRTLADLAELAANRVPITYSVVAGLAICLNSEDSSETVERLSMHGHALRCVANLVAPAGWLLRVLPQSQDDRLPQGQRRGSLGTSLGPEPERNQEPEPEPEPEQDAGSRLAAAAEREQKLQEEPLVSAAQRAFAPSSTARTAAPLMRSRWQHRVQVTYVSDDHRNAGFWASHAGLAFQGTHNSVTLDRIHQVRTALARAHTCAFASLWLWLWLIFSVQCVGESPLLLVMLGLQHKASGARKKSALKGSNGGCEQAIATLARESLRYATRTSLSSLSLSLSRPLSITHAVSAPAKCALV